MKELIKCITQALVDNPDQVSVAKVEGNQISVINSTSVINPNFARFIANHEPR